MNENVSGCFFLNTVYNQNNYKRPQICAHWQILSFGMTWGVG